MAGGRARSGRQPELGGTMNLFDLLLLLLVAAICGSIGNALAGGTRGGCLVAIAVGMIGALLGTWLARALELPELLVVNVGPQPFPIVWSIIGGALFVALLNLLSGGRGQPRRR